MSAHAWVCVGTTLEAVDLYDCLMCGARARHRGGTDWTYRLRDGAWSRDEPPCESTEHHAGAADSSTGNRVAAPATSERGAP